MCENLILSGIEHETGTKYHEVDAAKTKKDVHTKERKGNRILKKGKYLRGILWYNTGKKANKRSIFCMFQSKIGQRNQMFSIILKT